jgi:hypothetical protein
MGTLERRDILTHRLGSAGRLTVKAVSGTLRVRGIEGDEAHVTVIYRIRAADQAAAERALESGHVLISRADGSLEVETPERRLSTGLAWLFGGGRVNADITAEVPWGTMIRFETMSGSIEAQSLTGDQRYRTVSGNIRLWGLAGLVEAGSIAGSVNLDGGGDLRLRSNTVSGAIRARAGIFRTLILSTTSGGISVVGSLDPTGDFRAESISGGVELITPTGVTVELKTISGSIRSEIDHRLEGSRGFWRAVTGDGGAAVRVNSTSGSVKLLKPRFGEQVPSSAPAAPSSVDASASGEASETWSPDETGGSPAEEAEHDADEAEELAVLQALERGEIGVDEAAERLERAKR